MGPGESTRSHRAIQIDLTLVRICARSDLFAKSMPLLALVSVQSAPGDATNVILGVPRRPGPVGGQILRRLKRVAAGGEAKRGVKRGQLAS